MLNVVAADNFRKGRKLKSWNGLLNYFIAFDAHLHMLP